MAQTGDVRAAMRGTVVEAEEDVPAAIDEDDCRGVETGRIFFCCRRGEGMTFNADAVAIASATLLVISASCCFASCAMCLSCASSNFVWSS